MMSRNLAIVSPRRRGVTAVLAMLYLMLFSTLAIGFFASVSTSVQLARNDQSGAKALLAAESGIQFMRYQLAHVAIPPNTPSNQVLSQLYSDLKANLENTANLTGYTVGLASNTISIPAEANGYIKLDTTEKTGFSVSITEWGGNIICRVNGQTGATKSARGVSLDFTRQSLPTAAFNYAVASKGKILMQKGTLTGVSSAGIASVLSAKDTAPAITMTGGTIGGDLQVIGAGLASVTGGSVGGTSTVSQINSAHVHVVENPEFPVVDTTVFKDYAVNTYTSGSTLKNIRIPAGTNPKFNGGANIQGILYIESPNTVEFKGNVLLQGFIVFENKNTSAVNVIEMSGNFTHNTLPAGSEFDSLRSTTGVAILGPTASLNMTGSVDSTLKGNVILGNFTNGGSADITIDQGTLMTLDTTGTGANFNGKTVKFTSTGQSNQPSQGMSYSTKYTPVGGSFQELSQ